MTTSFMPIRAVFLAAGVVLLSLEAILFRRVHTRNGTISFVLVGWGLLNIALVIFLLFNHMPFPLNLDLMEGTVLQHFQRASEFQPIYIAPSAAFTPLAYNPLYYVFSIPFGWVFGVNLPTLRLVSVLGMLGSAAILYLVVRQKTNSMWWGLLTVGLFAAAYRMMDAYLNTAHSDSWFLFTALLGSCLIDLNRSRRWNLVGVLALIASFWFKQHGALFVIGGLLYLSWREGIRRSLTYWVAAVILGPVLYLFAGPIIFGDYFHYFTWQVPRQWTEFNLSLLRRYLLAIVGSYFTLALSGIGWTLWTVIRHRKALTIWQFQLVFALAAGFLGTLDPGSADNVYIPMGTLLILTGVLGLAAVVKATPSLARYRVHWLALIMAFVLLLYSPAELIVPGDAQAKFEEFTEFLAGLDGTVYAPWLGQLQNGYVLDPAAHWVGLEDMVRGPGLETANNPLIRDILMPITQPNGPAYILANSPLETFLPLSFLMDYYVLDTDLGTRFASLSVLPKRFYHGYPRYLYRYDPVAATTILTEGTS